MTAEKRVVDLSCDLGESYGNFKVGRDEEVIPFIVSASVGCGFHGGDPTTMRRTVERAASAGVKVGAHPGFPDLLGFGRRNMDVQTADLVNYVLYQLGAMSAMCKAVGVAMQHVKAHGALSDMAAQDRGIAAAIVEAVMLFDPGLVVYTTWNSEVERVASDRGLRTALEVYVDRCVDDHGLEIPGYDPSTLGGSVDSAIERVISALATGRLRTNTGGTVEWSANSVCFHGDTVDTLSFASGLRRGLEGAGFAVKAPATWDGNGRA